MTPAGTSNKLDVQNGWEENTQHNVYYYYHVLWCTTLSLVWCPCRWASPRHCTVDPMLSASGNLFKCHEEVLYLQPLIPPKRFDIFPLITGECSEGLGVLRFFFRNSSSLQLWYPCLAINVNVQYNGGLLPDIILLTQCYLHRGTCLNAMKRFCICSLRSHLNVLTFFPP